MRCKEKFLNASGSYNRFYNYNVYTLFRTKRPMSQYRQHRESPPPDFLIPCANEVQLNRFWKPINDRSWGGGAAYLYYHLEYFGCSWFSVVSFTATTYMLWLLFIPCNFCFSFAFGYVTVC